MTKQIAALLAVLPKGMRVKLVRFVFDRIWARYATEVVTGKENIPDGPCLFICNHLSNADGYTLYRAFKPKEVFFLAGVKLQGTALTRLGTETVPTIPIKAGAPDVEALKRSVERLKAGDSVLIFPEGTRSRTGKLIRGRKGAALIAKRAGVPIVPVALTGTEQFLPINESDMGGEQPREATLTVRFGKPFMVDELELAPDPDGDERQALVDAMMRKVAEMLPPEYRGHYA